MEYLLFFLLGFSVGMLVAGISSYSRGWTHGKKAALNSVYGRSYRSQYPAEFRPAARKEVDDV